MKLDPKVSLFCNTPKDPTIKDGYSARIKSRQTGKESREDGKVIDGEFDRWLTWASPAGPVPSCPLENVMNCLLDLLHSMQGSNTHTMPLRREFQDFDPATLKERRYISKSG
eukprot:g21471.t1